MKNNQLNNYLLSQYMASVNGNMNTKKTSNIDVEKWVLKALLYSGTVITVWAVINEILLKIRF